jgi:3-hydroxyacyl-[acyl-carrier-protein] dehydratase
MPGVLILEALAQAAGLLAFDAMGRCPMRTTSTTSSASTVRASSGPVEPGDQLILEITIDRVRAGIWKFKGVARVGDEVACEAELMCTMRAVG